jgi:hypothetical protein
VKIGGGARRRLRRKNLALRTVRDMRGFVQPADHGQTPVKSAQGHKRECCAIGSAAVQEADLAGSR